MKRFIFFLTLLLSIGSSLQAQKNEIKGRIGVLPYPFMFLIGAGLGYERMLSPQVSSQLTFNYMVYDISNTDAGGSFIFKTITPEFRYYFQEKSDESKPVFMGMFLEMGVRDLDFGEVENGPVRSQVDAISKEFNPGILIGRYGKFNKGKTKYEAFIGYKHRFLFTENIWKENNIRTKENTRDNTWGLRAGINFFVFRF